MPATCPAIVSVSAAVELPSITSGPAAVSPSAIDDVTTIVLLPDPFVSAAAMAARKAGSVATSNVLRAMRDSRTSRRARSE